MAQDRPHVTHYVRQQRGKWLRSDIIGLNTEVRLESINVSLPLAEIYWQIRFPAPEVALGSASNQDPQPTSTK